MAGQYPPYPQRAFSPLQRTASPHGSPYPMDPSKRSMYPNGSPQYGSPAPSNIALPNQVFSSPYYGTSHGTPQQNGTSPQGHGYPSGSPYSPHPSYQPSLHSPSLQQPPQTVPPATGTMRPPPPKMANDNKPTDINDLGDVLSGSGIDLKEEEAAMYGSYPGGRHQPQEPTPTPYPFSRENHYSPYTPGDRQSFYGAGSFNQAPAQYRSIEAIAEEEKKLAVRRKAEIKQYHLNDPFLQSGVLQRRFEQERNKHHVKFDDVGLLTGSQNQPPREFQMHGPDNHAVVRILQDESILQLDSTLAEVLALLSLATEERLRVVVEDATVLARGRRIGALGVPLPDLEDPKPSPENPETPPQSNPLKRSYAEANSLTNPVSSGPSNPVVQTLRELGRIERIQEEARLAKRRQRAAKAKGEPSALEAATVPGALGEVAPDVKKAPKKAKGAMDNATQAQQLNALNNTTQMALGGKKLPSWMSGGPKGPSNPYAKTNANTQKNTTAMAGGSGEAILKVRGFGDFREDKSDGKGIQLRDVLLVLERSNKERKALQRAYSKMQ